MKPEPLNASESSPLRSVHTSNLPSLFDQLRISLVVSAYQAGKVILVRNDNGALNTHFRTFPKPMGIAADHNRLIIGGSNTVWEYRNMPSVAAKLEPAGKHDACYLPRRIHVTGDIDIHELAWDGSNELWVVNTRFCCLCTLDANHSFYNSTAYGSSGNVTIANSTISGNPAEDGGGVFNSFYCSYYYCYFGTLNLNRSLISGNRAGTGPEIENFGTINADNFNLFGANGRSRVVGFTPGLTDIVPARGVRVGKILDRLKDNGGPTKTHALKPGSPALDAVPFTDPSCTGTDQRGIDRRGTGCDIGAFKRIP